MYFYHDRDGNEIDLLIEDGSTFSLAPADSDIGKNQGFWHKSLEEYEFSLKYIQNTGYFANNRVKIVLYA